MNVLDRIAIWLAQQRGFVIGPGVVDPSERVSGHDDSQFSPEHYGDYIATSNGVYACATLRAELLSSLPLKAYRLKKNGDKAEITTGPLIELLQKVNPFWTLNRLITMTELSLCLWGECFWFLERGATRRTPPTEIWWTRPDRVRVVPHGRDYIAGFLYQPALGGTELPFSPAETVWLRYPNPLDEFSGLAPLAAARGAADYSTSAMRANKLLFDQGMQTGGWVLPKQGTTLSPEQAGELELQFDRRFKGVDKAHRWGILRFEAQINPSTVSARDAEFLGGLKWSLEDICRAYRVPLDLIGGQRTYENTDAAYRGIWTNAILPEARFIGSELTEQLLPMFLAQADLLMFDHGEVTVLQEAHAERWNRAREQIQTGALLINEWREENGQKPLEWGDVWWAPANLIAIRDAAEPAPPPATGTTDNLELPNPDEMAMDELPPAEGEQGGQGTDTTVPPGSAAQDQAEPNRAGRGIFPAPIVYGSPAHERLWRRFDRRIGQHERLVARAVADLFVRQRESVLARLRGRSVAGRQRDAVAIADEPFDRAEWVKKFRITIRPVYVEIARDAGTTALDDLGLSISFDVLDPRVVRFLEQRAQRFAQQVNATTWDDLKASLRDGIQAGESIPDLAARVSQIMGDRIRSSAETIARTETIGVFNGGTLEAWRQSDVVREKEWLATLDDRTRDTHAEAHGQRVPVDADFVVGGARGPAPGQLGAAEEDINCRCTITAVLK